MSNYDLRSRVEKRFEEIWNPCQEDIHDVDYYEFKKGIKQAKIPLSPTQTETLFKAINIEDDDYLLISKIVEWAIDDSNDNTHKYRQIILKHISVLCINIESHSRFNAHISLLYCVCVCVCVKSSIRPQLSLSHHNPEQKYRVLTSHKNRTKSDRYPRLWQRMKKSRHKCHLLPRMQHNQTKFCCVYIHISVLLQLKECCDWLCISRLLFVNRGLKAI